MEDSKFLIPLNLSEIINTAEKRMIQRIGDQLFVIYKGKTYNLTVFPSIKIDGKHLISSDTSPTDGTDYLAPIKQGRITNGLVYNGQGYTHVQPSQQSQSQKGNVQSNAPKKNDSKSSSSKSNSSQSYAAALSGNAKNAGNGENDHWVDVTKQSKPKPNGTVKWEDLKDATNNCERKFCHMVTCGDRHPGGFRTLIGEIRKVDGVPELVIFDVSGKKAMKYDCKFGTDCELYNCMRRHPGGYRRFAV